MLDWDIRLGIPESLVMPLSVLSPCGRAEYCDEHVCFCVCLSLCRYVLIYTNIVLI